MGDRETNIDNVRSVIIQTIEGIIGSARLKVSGLSDRRASREVVVVETIEEQVGDKMVQGSGILKTSNLLGVAEEKTIKEARKRSVTFDPKFLKDELGPIITTMECKRSDTKEDEESSVDDNVEITRL